MSGTCGRTWRAPFAFYDPGTCSLRTSAGTFDLGLTESSPTLPDWGTWAAGEFYELPTPELPTAEPASSSLLPTPTATPYGNNQSPSPGAAVRPSLDSLVPTLLPTPRATDGTKGGPNQRGSSGDLMLPSAVLLLPTPTAMDAHSSGGNSPMNVTLTDAVVRTRLGARTNPRFAAGNGRSGDPLHDLLSPDDEGSD